MGFLDAWSDPAHVRHFDLWSRVPLFVLRDRYERFNEVQLLNSVVDGRKSPFLLLEVGCATGEFFRYFRSRHPLAEYVGCDISDVAVSRAREKFGTQGTFIQTEAGLDEVRHIKPDVLFCRDVLLHQPQPYAFLRILYSFEAHHLILRLRTRDIGQTESDPAKSCQLNYGQWAPYMVLNSKELIGIAGNLSPRPSEIVLRKHYMVLGGQHARFLPKDCYFPETRTAESALMITRERCDFSTVVREYESKENLKLRTISRIATRMCTAIRHPPYLVAWE
jgi:hypothetical protein